MSAVAEHRGKIEGLFARHHRRLYRLALRMTSDPGEAEDLVQECFLRVARQPRRVPEVEPRAEAWLVRTLVNLCRDRHRRLQVRQRSRWRLADAEGVNESAESATVAKATLERGLRELSPRRRAILVLHELEGLPVAGIASRLGLARATVRWHLAAARRELSRHLSADGREERS